jgi:hypothetical protein
MTRIVGAVPNQVPNDARPGLSEKKEIPLECGIADGETRTRTGDTTIFSRVLYQLSYLAAAS